MDHLQPEILNPLSHSGTSQYERMAEEMHFDYVKIEERHEHDFLAYAARLTDTITYYDHGHQPAGTWKAFFDENTPDQSPQKALFIAFLRLLEALNEHANGLLPKHLDYYYEDVLQFTTQHAEPQKVHLFFKCAKTLETRLLAKGTNFEAGKNTEGRAVLLQTVDELIINRASLSACLATFKHPEAFGERLFTNDFTSKLIDDQITEGLPLFGESQLVFEKFQGTFREVFQQEEDQTMAHGTLGIALSTSLFKMAEGQRTVKISFHFENPVPDYDAEAFAWSCTGEEAWNELRPDQVTAYKTNNATELTFELVFANTDPGIASYDAATHGGQYNTPDPVFRLLLRHDPAKNYAYTAWKKAVVEEVKLKAMATGVRSLIFQNDASLLEAAKPFSPFGPVPAVGNHFYIGHEDIFNENLLNAQLNIRWKEMPQSDLGNHYQYYPGGISNSSFKASASLLDSKEWYTFNGEVALFDAQDATSPTLINFSMSDLPAFTRKPGGTALEKWDYNTSHGFLRLTLSSPHSPDFSAFGHNAYNQTVRTYVNSNHTIHQPYSPVVEQITLDYETAEVSLSLSTYDHFYHELPFGQQEIPVEGLKTPKPLLPSLNAEGVLYLGLQHLAAPQSVSMLFQLKEGSGEAGSSQVSTGIGWSYLSGNEWHTLDRLRISKDTSNNLLHTGIIQFDLPADIDMDHQVMPTGHYWLRAEMPAQTAGLDQIQSIHLQAVELVEAEAGSSDQILAPDTIKKLQSGGKGIAVVAQPYASFEGRKAEDQPALYQRAHERLRHKDRGVAIWDYERLVLERFPILYKVKCLNHTNYATEVAAGHVMIAVIPDLKNQDVESPFQPKIGSYQRVQIYDFLRERISPFIYLRVVNPVYEPIRLSLNVGFHPGYDEGFYGKKLHTQIQEFLSPWAFENNDSYGKGLAFGGALHKSTLLKYIEDLPYVDFVNDFTMYHQYGDPSILARFADEIEDDVNQYSSVVTNGPAETFKIAFDVENPDRPTALIALEVRFLKGLLDLSDADLQQKFLKNFLSALKSKTKNGQPVTRTMIRGLLKSFYYVDKLLAISLHHQLPDGVVLEEVDVAKARTSRSVMVTGEQHRIGVYRAGDYKCEGNVLIGIGVMIVEADFIVSPIKTSNNELQAR